MSTACNRKLHSWASITEAKFAAYRLGSFLTLNVIILECKSYRAISKPRLLPKGKQHCSSDREWRPKADIQIPEHSVHCLLHEAGPLATLTSLIDIQLLLDPVTWQHIVAFLAIVKLQLNSVLVLCLTHLLLLVLMQFLNSAQHWSLSPKPANFCFYCKTQWMFAAKPKLTQNLWSQCKSQLSTARLSLSGTWKLLVCSNAVRQSICWCFTSARSALATP